VTHSEFVEAWKSRRIAVRVNKELALRVMSSPDMPRRYRAAHHFWAWIWLFSIPLAIALGIFVKWWVGLIVLIVGFLLPRAIKKSAMEFVIEHSVEDGEFYDKAINSGLLIVDENTL
jgi:uncharacterized membrane protein YdbT with pleckstrin-like domain